MLELGSHAWVGEARRYLTEAVAAVDSRLTGVRFSLCEVYTDPPRHLGGDTDRIAWHIVIDDGRVEVGRGQPDGIDQTVVVDYQTCVPLAKVHYPPMARPRDLDGPPRVPKELVPMMIDFHNHMAACTR
jgi:hypothetical protein